MLSYHLSSCANPAGPDTEKPPEGPTTGRIDLSFGTEQRSILPGKPVDYAVAAYRVLGVGPSGFGFDSGRLTGSEYSRTDAAPGDWSITVLGYNTGGHAVLSKTIRLTVCPAQICAAAVLLDRIPGAGTLETTVVWEAAGEYDRIEGILGSDKGTPVEVAFAFSEDRRSAKFISTIPAGEYTLALSLIKGKTILGSLVEQVRILEAYTSEATYSKAISTASNFAYNPANPVFPVSFESPVQSILISGAVGKQVYLVKSNPSAEEIGGASAAAAISAPEARSYSMPRGVGEASRAPDLDQFLMLDDPEVTAFNSNPPPIGRSPGARIENSRETGDTVTYGSASPFKVGVSARKFWVQDSSDSWIRIDATLRASGVFSYIWVADGNFDDASEIRGDNKLNYAQAESLRAKFDGSGDLAYSDGIFKNVTALLGFEYGGDIGGNGGMDWDQHISILIYDIGCDYSRNQTMGTFGYFWAKDFYSDAQLADWGLGAIHSNTAEIFYLDSHFTDLYPQQACGAIVHEYQHMVHFNRKYVALGQRSSNWFNEMCSLVCEDIVLPNIGVDPKKYGAQARLPTFMYHYAEQGVKDWDNGTISGTLKSYASSFAFGAYLVRNYGGAALLRNIMESGEVDENAVDAGLERLGYSATMADAFGRYGEAMVYSSPPSGSDVNTFNRTAACEVGGHHYTAQAIDLFGSEADSSGFKQYNQDTAEWIQSNGFRVFGPSDTTVPLKPYGNSIHTQASWMNIPDNFKVTLIRPPDGSSMRVCLMVK